MSATTTEPATCSPGGSTSGSFGAPNVTVSAASTTVPIGRRIVGGQAAWQVDRHHGHRRWRSDPGAMVSASPSSGVFRPVPNSASTTMSRRSTSLPCSSQSWGVRISTTSRPSLPRMSRFSFASPRMSAAAPTRYTWTSTPACQRTRATTKPSPPLLPRPASTATRASARSFEGRLHRRHDLAAGVLHEHHRGDAEVLDRAAVGFAHLVAVHYAHGPAPGTAGERGACGLRALYHKRYGTRPARRRRRGHSRETASMSAVAYVNGRIVRRAGRDDLGVRPRVSVRRRRLRSHSHVRAASCSWLDRHFRRLRASASMITLDVGMTDIALEGIIRETIDAYRASAGSAGGTPGGARAHPADARHRRDELRPDEIAASLAGGHRQAARASARIRLREGRGGVAVSRSCAITRPRSTRASSRTTC